MIGVLVLLLVFGAITYAFVRAAIGLFRYNKKLRDTKTGFGAAVREKYPGWHVWLKFLLPIVIVGFAANAIGGAYAFVYVLVRFVHDFL